MPALKQVLDQAKRLPARERQRLIQELEASAAERVRQRGNQRPQGLDMFLALAGRAHSRHSDVASDKAKHLGEIYCDKR